MASLQKSTLQSSLSPTSSQESFHTAPSSFVDQMQLAVEGHLMDRRPPPNVNFNAAIEHIQMQKAQEQMSIDGYDFVNIIKVSVLPVYFFHLYESAAVLQNRRGIRNY